MTFDELIAQVKRLSQELDRRCKLHDKLEPYYENEREDGAVPIAITEARMTKLYRYLLPVSDAPWGSLIVDSKLDRLEPSGITDGNKDAAKAAWEVWQDSHMDAESKLGHNAALLDGRFNATVWERDGKPDIALDDMTQMIVEYEEGNRYRRTAALRRWKEGERIFYTLYRPEGLYKFQTPKEVTYNSANEPNDIEKRMVKGEEWPAPNVTEGVVPVVEIRVNGRLKPGRFPRARGEFAHCTGLIDRINMLTFLGLVVAIWMGFPLRGIIGNPIRWGAVLQDDDGNNIIGPDGKPVHEMMAPFDSHPSSVAQFESPDARTFEFGAADRKNLSIYAELDQLASISKTARHYFPMENAIANISAETVTAFEGGMLAAVTGHKASLGEGWEEMLRLAGRVAGYDLSQRAELEWKKHESRSLAEQADAFVKFTSGNSPLPWMAAAELALNVTSSQLERWQSQEATSPLLKLIEAVQQPARNGNGVPAGVPAG